MEAKELKGQAVPLHAGLWGLARCLRLESPGSMAGCVDLGPMDGKASPQEIMTRPEAETGQKHVGVGKSERGSCGSFPK